MICYFVFFYFIGALVFFCHTAIITIKCSEILSSQIYLTDAEQEQLFVNYFAKILFQTVMMTVFPVSFVIYTKTNAYFSNTIFVSSGLFMVIWLMITGILIKSVYYFATQKIKKLKLDCDKYFRLQDKEFFWITCPMLYGILFNLYDHTIFFTIFAIVLGKYIWMDSFRLIPLSNIKMKINESSKNFKSNLLLLFCQASVMGYLLVRWYPIKDTLIPTEYTRKTFLLLFLFLMPVLDFLIYESMKSYSRFIKTSRE